MKLDAKAIALVMLLATCAWSGNAQVKPGNRVPVRTIIMQNVFLPSLLAMLGRDNEVTIGLEVEPGKSPPLVNLNLHDVNFSQIMDGLMKSESRYQWRERDGGVEVYPVKGATDFLDIPIQNFQTREVNREAAIWNLIAVPEVQAQWRSREWKPRPPSAADERIKAERLSFNLSGVTLRQALNQIAADSGTCFWIFRRFPDGTFAISTSFQP